MIELDKRTDEKPKKFWWHWQNLNDKKGGGQGSGLRHGRAWFHFASKEGAYGPSTKCVEFSWNIWAHFCGLGFDVDDEGLTLSLAFPPIAIWLTFSMNIWPLTRWPRRSLSATYPDCMIIDERECAIKIHGGRVWINPWSKTKEWVSKDPWWVKGISFSINPFEPVHQKHQLRCLEYRMPERPVGEMIPLYYWWTVPSWKLGQDQPKEPSTKEIHSYSYMYILKNGTVQTRVATVQVERRTWRPKCLQWTSLFEKERISIDVKFDDEVGEQSGSWKGGCIGCGWDLLPSETPLEALRRMEATRKF